MEFTKTKAEDLYELIDRRFQDGINPVSQSSSTCKIFPLPAVDINAKPNDVRRI